MIPGRKAQNSHCEDGARAGWGETFAGRPTALWNPLPDLEILANGAAGTVVLDYPASLSVSVALQAGDYAGTEVDLWVVAYAHSGEWFYFNRVLQWTRYEGKATPAAQGWLADLPPTTLLDRYQAARAVYDFWFMIAHPMDGILDLGKPHVLDQVTVVVQ